MHTLSAGHAACAVCGARTELLVQHFPQRRAPHGVPFAAALYFRDPFWGRGPLENYCSAACSREGHARTPAPFGVPTPPPG